MPDALTRRAFFCSLAALAVVAAVPLPIGVKPEHIVWVPEAALYDAGEYVQFEVAFPRSWDDGEVTFRLFWQFDEERRLLGAEIRHA